MVIHSTRYVTRDIPQGDGNGQHLTLESVHRQPGDSAFADGRILHGERSEVTTNTRNHYEKRGRQEIADLLDDFGVSEDVTVGFYKLDEEETYLASFEESPAVPDDHVGVVRPRQALIDTGATLHAGFVWPDDDGVEALLELQDKSLVLAEGSTIAELVAVPTAATGDD